MRLINTYTLALEEFLDHVVPPYAILSHTWGSDSEELTYQNLLYKEFDKPGVGSTKLHGCCQLARRDGHNYCWIDTCCIDKTNLVELSEAINSMFRWYREADVCYAYLADVSSTDSLRLSRWFRRGWTLQELLAPKVVQFFNLDWDFLGTKVELCSMLYTITGVPHRFLRGSANLQTASIAQRMSWASHRDTKRKEDLAYCLLGIFDVTMPMIYGEGGENAFFRLQEQIMKKTRDDSLLAWGISTSDADESVTARAEAGRILATTPSEFANSGKIIARSPSDMHTLDMSGGSLRVSLRLVTSSGEKLFGLLNCGPERDPTQVIGIPLAKLTQESKEYVRPKAASSTLQPIFEPGILPESIYIRNVIHIDAPTVDESKRRLYYDEEAFSDIHLSLVEVQPKACWDREKALILLDAKDDPDAPYLVLARFRHDIERSNIHDFVVLMDFEDTEHRCPVFICSRDTSLKRLLGKVEDIAIVSRQGIASNGQLHLAVSLKFDERLKALNLRPEAIPNPPNYTINATLELNRLELMMELEKVLEREATADAQENEASIRVQEKLNINERIQRDVRRIESEQERLKESKAALINKQFREFIEMESLIKEQESAQVKRERIHERRLLVQQRCYKLFEELVSDDNNGTLGSSEDQVQLEWASRNGHLRTVQVILQKTTSIESILHDTSALLWASRRGNESIVKVLLDQGADVELKDAQSRATALSLASMNGHATIVKRLLDNNACLESQDDSGRTPLSWAAFNGHATSVQLLIDGGANIHKEDTLGRSPLSWATLAGREEIVHLLCSARVSRISRDMRDAVSSIAERRRNSDLTALHRGISPLRNHRRVVSR